MALSFNIQALKYLLKICEQYSLIHSITFNPKKTKCIAFLPRGFEGVLPEIRLCGAALEWCNCVRYLGYDVSAKSCDVDEISRRRREMYMRGNLISSKFRVCNVSVKKYLFSTYFGNIYCMSMWDPANTSHVDKVKVVGLL